MRSRWSARIGCCCVGVLLSLPAGALGQAGAVVGLAPKAPGPITFDGKLDDWAGAFVTPVHIGHPDFKNRGAAFYYLWDEENLYIGMSCLDQKPAHVGKDDQIWNGDAVEFYLDTRRGGQLGAKEFGPGALHMFYTPFTGTEIKPRLQVRPLPVFKNFQLKGAEVKAARTAWGWTAEFKLPWHHFPDFKPQAGEIIGIDCELCSSDGGPRADRTFVYSGPSSVGTPSTFGRVKLVDKLDSEDLRPYSAALLPVSLTKSANYGWLYATAGLSASIAKQVAQVEAKILDAKGKERKRTTGKIAAAGPLTLWTGNWEFFDLGPGTYVVEIAAKDKQGKTLAERKVSIVHGK